MINLLAKISNWKFILPSILIFAFFLGYLFSKYQTQMNEIAGQQVPMIDVRESYTLEIVTDLFTKLQPEGRAVHEYMTSVIDMIFPFSYGIMFILLFAYFIKIFIAPDSKWMYLALFPILLMIFDYWENMNTLSMLADFPNLTEDAVNSAAQITELKGSLVMFCNSVVVIGAMGAFIRWGMERLK